MSELKKHSKPGIASCLIAFGIWIYFGLLLYLFFNVEGFAKLLGEKVIPESRGMTDFSGLGTAIFLIILLFFIIPAVGHLVGFFLGLIGCMRENTKKLFAVVGIILNAVPFILGLIIYLVGSFSGS